MREGSHLELHNTLQVLAHFRQTHDMSVALDLFVPQSVRKSAEDIDNEDEEVIKRLFYLKMIGSQRKAKVYRIDDE